MVLYGLDMVLYGLVMVLYGLFMAFLCHFYGRLWQNIDMFGLEASFLVVIDLWLYDLSITCIRCYNTLQENHKLVLIEYLNLNHVSQIQSLTWKIRHILTFHTVQLPER